MFFLFFLRDRTAVLGAEVTSHEVRSVTEVILSNSATSVINAPSDDVSTSEWCYGDDMMHPILPRRHARWLCTHTVGFGYGQVVQ